MYRLMRNVHLILGLVFVVGLLIYGLSSLRVAQRNWFPAPPTVNESRVEIELSHVSSGRELGLLLMNEHQLSGEIVRVQQTEDGFSLVIRRLGTNHEVSYSRRTREAVIRTRRQDFMGMLMGLHVAHGLWHDYWPANLWGVFVGLVSLGLFLLGATGIYLWFKTYEERVIGSVLLGIGLVYGITMMVLTRTLG